MFGYVTVNKGDMTFNEFDVYHSYYCGLCRSLHEKYGLGGQLSLSYDMTFLVMLLDSLYEPEIKEEKTKCLAHPFKKHLVRRNEFTDYAADMNVLFTYYKCRDDWQDEHKADRLAYGKILEKGYRKICAEYKEKAKKIDFSLRELAAEEKKRNYDIDYMSGLFGRIMSEFVVVKEDEWQEELGNIGNYLGKYIYLLDAYEDIEEDIKKDLYNPFYKKYEDPDFDEEVKEILTMMMAGCCRVFERLPVIENAGILRNILYSGVWYRYEKVRKERRE